MNQAVTYDDVIKHIGWGRYQKLWILYSFVLGLVTGVHALSSIFIGYPIPFVCDSPAEELWHQKCNGTGQNTTISFVPIEQDSNHLDQCRMYNPPLEHINCTTWDKNMSIEVIPCREHRFISDGLVSTSIVIDFDITCERSWINYMLQSVFMVGVFINGIIFGKLGDRYGRRSIILVMACSTVVVTFCLAFIRDLILYTILRGVVGLFCFVLVISYVLTSESVKPRYRALSVQMGSMGFSVGCVVLVLLAYIWREWKTLQIATSCFSISAIVICWVCDESPRWLISKGRHKEGLRILHKIAQVNKVDQESMFVLNSYERQIEESKDAECFEEGKTSTDRNGFGMLSTLRYSGLRLQTIVLSYAWFVTSCVFYGMTLNVASIGGDVYVNTAVMGVMGIPSNIIATILCNKIGRGVVIYSSFLLCGVFCFAMYIVPEDLKWLSLILFLLGRVFSLIPFSTLFLYTIELYPTLMRSTASNYGSAMARIGAIVAPAIASLQIFHPSVPYVTFGALSLVSGILMMLLPETRKARMFEGMEEANEFTLSNPGPLLKLFRRLF